MQPVLTRAESRAFDKKAIETCHVPSMVLMENAGRGATNVLVESLARRNASGRVLVVCGLGNNGGDGYVVARHLLVQGWDVRVVGWTGRDGKLSPDADVERAAFIGVGGVVTGPQALAAELSSAAVVVDALFGTGLDRDLEGEFAAAVAQINTRGVFTYALDLPSGLCADTGRTLGVCVRAHETVTFAFQKRGLCTANGQLHAGAVHVVDIGVPPSLLGASQVNVTSALDVRRVLLPRSLSAHKYTAGHVAILGGSLGTLGAALLASNAALRAGAGAATILTWPDAAAAAAARVMEVMTAALHGPSAEMQSASAIAHLAKKHAAVVGPGFGTNELAKKVVEQVVTHATLPLVLDADGITAFAGRAGSLAVAEGRAVLTPHEGELARLLGVTSAEIAADRYGFVARAARETKCIVLLKGPCTLIASPDGDILVNRTGNAALATAGAGDVLSGIIGALLCTLSPLEAAWVGAYLHGAAADLWAEENGDRGLLAHEVAERVPRVLANTLCVSRDAHGRVLNEKS